MAKYVVTVLGMGDRVVGKNRETGKPYDFCRVAFGFVNQWGTRDVSVNLIDGTTLDELTLLPGREYYAIVNQIKKQYYIDLIGSVDS